MALHPAQQNLLVVIANATAGFGYSWQNPKSPIVKQLESQGLVEGNAEMKNPANADQYAYRPTAKAAEYLPQPVSEPTPEGPVAAAAAQREADAAAVTEPGAAEPGATEPGAAPAAPRKRGRPAGATGPRGPQVVPVVHSGGARMPALPAAKMSGGSRESALKFDKLLPPDATGYDSFFIEATQAVPNPARQYNSAVSRANKKANPAIEYKITAMAVGQDHEFTDKAGARVIRTK